MHQKIIEPVKTSQNLVFKSNCYILSSFLTVSKYYSMYSYTVRVNLKIVNFKKENGDCKKLPKQDEDTGNEFY